MYSLSISPHAVAAAGPMCMHAHVYVRVHVWVREMY